MCSSRISLSCRDRSGGGKPWNLPWSVALQEFVGLCWTPRTGSVCNYGGRLLNQGLQDSPSLFNGVLSGELRAVSYTHLRAHETGRNLVCRLLLEKKQMNMDNNR